MDNALADFYVDPSNNLDPFAQQENDEVAETLNLQCDEESADEEPIENEQGNKVFCTLYNYANI